MSDWVFDRDAVRAFRFVRCGFDAATGVARLVYAFDDGPELVETVTLPGAPFELDAARVEAAEQALRLLHLIAVDILTTGVALQLGPKLRPLMQEIKRNLRSKRYAA